MNACSPSNHNETPADPANRLRLLCVVLGALATPLALSGCNTTEGFGEDMESAGENLSDEAEDAGG